MWEDSTLMRVKTPGIAIARGLRRLWPLAALVAAGTVLPVTAGVASAGVHDSAYRQVNLRSDIPGLAAVTDPDLVNSWGVSASAGTDQAPGGALWVSDNGKDKTTLLHLGNRDDRQQGWPDRHDHLWRADRPGIQQRYEPGRLRRA
jgi:hypothetical protein